MSDGEPRDETTPTDPARSTSSSAARPPTAKSTPTQTNRRAFLTAAAIGAAGLGVGAVAGAVGASSAGPRPEPTFPVPTPTDPPGFAHVVVLMGENRSFDNLLGRLYGPDAPPPREQSFAGLDYGDYTNTAPDGTVIPAQVYAGGTDEIMRSPDPDPGEEYPHVNTQWFGAVDPDGNENARVADMREPYNAPPPGTAPTMSGFVRDYAAVWREAHGRDATTEELARAMGGFTPEMLPVLSTLARGFAVYDNWFAAVPSQTFCNRSFFHASTSHGYVTNQHGGGYRKWLDAPAAPTVFDRLEEAGLDWRIYFDALSLVSYTGMIHAPALEKYWKTAHFADMAQFERDAADGTLPAYAFIEPRLVFNHNDFHPPVGQVRRSDVDGSEVYDSAESDVRAGEALVARVYDAIRTSASATGSNALNTLLLITFDEHGGTYDHVPPPPAVAPDGGGAGEMGFTFDRLGGRVPAIAVSAYTAAGTVIHDEMHHGSLMATLSRLHGLEPLTARDAGAPDLFSAITLDAPRDPSTWPRVHPAWTPPNPEADPAHPAHANRDKPLSSPAKGLLGILLAKYDPRAPEPSTFAEAYEVLDTHGRGLFGVGDIP
ncbi:MAG: hypothetical protein J0G30_07760 [Actinomycetales bacterium]|nr:hypothetical protein [Actinomycetales bacterium]